MRTASEPLVLRPRPVKQALGVLAPTIAVALQIIPTVISGSLLGALIIGAITVLVFGLLFTSALRSRIEITPGEIVVTDFLRRKHAPRSQAAALVRAWIAPPRGRAVDTIFVVDHSGGLLVRVQGNHYAPEDFERVVHALGLPCYGPPRPVTGKQLSTLYPNLVSVLERRPYALALGLAGGALLTFVVVVVVVLGLLST